MKVALVDPAPGRIDDASVFGAWLVTAAAISVPVVVVDTGGTTGPPDWWTLRLADRVAFHLVVEGVGLAHPLAVVEPPADVRRISLSARHEDGEEAAVLVTFALDDHRATVRGALSDLDRLARTLAERAAEALGRPPGEVTPSVHEQPMELHRLLGRARQRELQGRFLQAQLMYDRASVFADRLWMDGLLGWARVRALQADETQRDTDNERADGALIRARVARRNGQTDQEVEAWTTFLKFTPSRLRRWSQPLSFPADADAFVHADRIVLQREGLRVLAVPPTGAGALRWQPTDERIVAAGPNFDLAIAQGRLYRRNFDGSLGWSLPMPALEGARFSGGFVAAWDADRVRWIDPTHGKVVRAVSAAVLAVGERGALTQRRNVLTFHRAGQEAPAWSNTTTVSVRAAYVVGERTLILTEGDLVIWKTKDGRPMGRPIPRHGQPVLGASRHHVVLADGIRIRVVDVISGQPGPYRYGPSAAVVATGRPGGVAVGFESGHLQFFDGTGRLVAGAILPEAPVSLWSRPHRGELIVLGRHQVTGISDLTEGELTDVDAILALARIAWHRGQAADALRLVDWAEYAAGGSHHTIDEFRRTAGLEN